MNRLLYCSVERATTRVFVNTCRNMIYLRFCTVCRGQLLIDTMVRIARPLGLHYYHYVSPFICPYSRIDPR